ncbi:hypothetical protein BB560_005543, partial [Smittium megazygosporum]
MKESILFDFPKVPKSPDALAEDNSQESNSLNTFHTQKISPNHRSGMNIPKGSVHTRPGYKSRHKRSMTMDEKQLDYESSLLKKQSSGYIGFDGKNNNFPASDVKKPKLSDPGPMNYPPTIQASNGRRNSVTFVRPHNSKSKGKCKSGPRSRTGSIDISLLLDESAVLKQSEPGKLPHSYATIITFAILRHPEQRMSLNEIYNWVSDKYPYVKSSGVGWKNSIRHNLSLNRVFVKMQKTEKKTGKGSYWTVDFAVLGEAIATSARKRRIPPELLFSTGLWSRLGIFRSMSDQSNDRESQEKQRDQLGKFLSNQFFKSYS